LTAKVDFTSVVADCATIRASGDTIRMSAR
jgi:hypothetical protein